MGVQAQEVIHGKNSHDTTLFDTQRNRQVPVAFYFPPSQAVHPKVIIFSHGYGGNKGGDYKAYTYLTDFLTSQGYFVACIQHELISDEPLPMTGELKTARRPNWERGAQNILFTIKEMKGIYPSLDFEHLTLIGHSNGGDMSVLFAKEYPQFVDKVISLDNRRMPCPEAPSRRCIPCDLATK